jgi:hypothetical protein
MTSVSDWSYGLLTEYAAAAPVLWGMTKLSILLTAVAATMLLAAPAALAKTVQVPTGGGGGHASVTISPRDEGRSVAVRTCDDDGDGFRVVAWAFDGSTLDAVAQDGNGADNGCGSTKRFVDKRDLKIQVCLYDQSAHGPLDTDDPSEARNPNLAECRSRTILA